MCILYLSCGIPGSGKSTFLKNYIHSDEVLISRDDIRFALLKEGEEYFSHEDKVFDIFTNIIIANLKENINTYADATHLNKASRNKLLYTLKRKAPELKYDKELIFFDVPLKTCLERNEQRAGRKTYVPKAIIKRMYYQSEIPDKETEDFLHCWVVDKNGTVSKAW